MRIGINCHSFLNRRFAGIGRYAYNLVKELIAIDQANAYVLYAKKGWFDFRKKAPKFPAGNCETRLDRRSSGPARCLGDVDVFHAPSPGPVDVPGAKVVVTVHDLVYLAYPRGHTPDALRATEDQLQEAFRRADKIICVSHSTRRDLHRYFKIAGDKTVVIHQGVDKDIFRPLKPDEEASSDAYLQARGLGCPYLLWVGTIEPRKNLEHAIRAFSLCRQRGIFQGKLAVVGKKGWGGENIPGLIRQCRLEDDVVFLDFVCDKTLRLLYNRCEALVFPSFYEGFGFPILEAFCCGAAVVTSDVSSCAEIAGDAALKVPPGDPTAIAEALEGILQDRLLRERLRERALKRAEAFSFRRTAEETLAVYRAVWGETS